MATFDTVDNTLELFVPAKGETIAVAISGTYVQVIDLQRELGSRGSGAWVTTKQFNTENATEAFDYVTLSNDENVRLFLRTQTSGSSTVTLADTSDLTEHVIRDRIGNVLATFRQAGPTFTGVLNYGSLNDGTTTTTATALELNYLDIGTLGTGAASKAVVLDGSENFTWPVGGVLTYGVLADASTTVTATAAELNILDTVTATAAELNYLDITTLGTGVNTKAVVPDANGDFSWEAGGIVTIPEIVYTTSINDGTTTLGATVLELNAVADTSARLIAAGSTLSITQALHDGRTILWDTLTGSILTLPAATGSGMRIRCVVSVTATSNDHSIACVGTDNMLGTLTSVDTDTADAVVEFAAQIGDTMDTITFNRAATGLAAIGDWVELEDVVSGAWAVRGMYTATGSVLTAFSSVVS